MLAPGILLLVAPDVHGSLRIAIVWGLSVPIAWASWHLLNSPAPAAIRPPQRLIRGRTISRGLGGYAWRAQ